MTKPYKLSALSGKVIAIDGPAGSGKSTTAKLLALRMGYVYLDTGAMYRAITLYALRNNVALNDAQVLTDAANKILIRFQAESSGNKVYLNDEDVTLAIRSQEVTASVSEVSAHPGVREAMVRQQRQIAKSGNIVAEGRDTTSVVFPKADIKIYLDASLKERARRRLLDFVRMNVDSSLDEQIHELTHRDAFDSNRKHSPLAKTGDSIVIDTTNLSVEEQVERIIKLVKTRFMQV
jgi:cytidylate kinase